jgi:hypothetical protein
MDPHPTHLDEGDPAKRGLGIREETDREIEAYRDLANLVLLVPEDRWDELMRSIGADGAHGQALYRGVQLRKGAVTAVIAQEGF